jgi:hypothetical protein
VTQTRSPAPLSTEPVPSPRACRGLDEALREAVGLLSADRAAQASTLAHRWRERVFVVLIAGEFKRGKSTLVNALAGVDLQPTGVLPVTAVPTRVQSGPAAAWTDEARPALVRRIDETCRHAARRARAEVSRDLLRAGREAVDGFLEAFLPTESDRAHSGYERLRREVTDAAGKRAEAVWRAAADLLPIQPPRVDPPATPLVPQPSGLQLEPTRLMLEDLEDALAAFLPRRMALRRLAERARRGALLSLLSTLREIEGEA